MVAAKVRGPGSRNPGIWFAFGAVGLAVACSGEDERPDVIEGVPPGARPSVSVPPGSGGNSGRGNQNGEGGEPSSDPDAPSVTVISPMAASEPNDADILVSTEIDVVCRVEESRTADAAKVDQSSVKIDMLDAEGKQLESASAAPTDEADEYRAHFFLTKVEDNGPVSFRCSAVDVSTPPRLGFHTIETFYDRGPLITPVAPVPNSAHPLLGTVRFEFTVEPSPVSDDDTEARVDEVSLEVNGVEIGGVHGDRGTYEAFVNFTDQDVFADIPNGPVPVILRATNLRTPEAAQREQRYSFVIDGEGPVIAISSPENEQVVGGQVELRFTVKDELSGVDRDSVVIELNGKENVYGEGGTWAHDGDNYVFLFDSTQAEKDSKIQATITIRAVDEVGNESDGESLIVYLDNVPPVVDLDPENVREARQMDPAFYCSYAFDPVGDFAANDREEVLDVTRVRALVADRTNEAPGQLIRYYSGQDKDSVYVYMQPDRSEPLLIDGNDDGYCDDVVEYRNDLPYQHLNGVAPAGNSWFGPEATDPTPAPADCDYQGSGAPKRLCDPPSSDLTRIVSWDVDEKVPMIFAIGALGQGPACTGTDWEIGQFLEEGWFCVAARAEDHVGNVGISPPLRLCYDDGVGAAPDCSDPPSCTDGCTPPERYPETIYVLR